MPLDRNMLQILQLLRINHSNISDEYPNDSVEDPFHKRCFSNWIHWNSFGKMVPRFVPTFSEWTQRFRPTALGHWLNRESIHNSFDQWQNNPMVRSECPNSSPVCASFPLWNCPPACCWISQYQWHSSLYFEIRTFCPYEANPYNSQAEYSRWLWFSPFLKQKYSILWWTVRDSYPETF